MTTAAEDSVYAALTDIDDLERLAAIGLPLEAIPTEEMRPVVKWAIDEFYKSGRRQAPSRALLMDNWAQVIEDCGVELIPEEQERDSIEAAVANLKGLHGDREWQTFIRSAAMLMAEAPLTEKVQTLQALTTELFTVSNSLVDTTNNVLAPHGIETSWTEYQGRKENSNVVMGMTTGWPLVDTHMGGIRAGELCVMAGGPKVGKSFFMLIVALNEIRQGRRCTLYTLENSVEMAYDRLMCIGARVDARAYQRGELSVPEEDLVRDWMGDNAKMLELLRIVSPMRNARTPEMIVRDALSYGTESIIVDQLTHVEHPNPGRKPRHEIFNDNVHEFKYLISAGRDRVPLLLAHQISREGVKAAAQTGHLEMWHLAESSGVERAADWVLSLFQNKRDRETSAAILQVLAARREDTDAWDMGWKPHMGVTNAVRRADLDARKPPQSS